MQSKSIKQLKDLFNEHSSRILKDNVFDVISNNPKNVFVRGCFYLSNFKMNVHGFLEENEYEKTVEFKNKLMKTKLFLENDYDGLDLKKEINEDMLFADSHFHFHPTQIMFTLNVEELLEIFEALKANLPEKAISGFSVFDMELGLEESDLYDYYLMKKNNIKESVLKSLTTLKRKQCMVNKTEYEWTTSRNFIAKTKEQQQKRNELYSKLNSFLKEIDEEIEAMDCVVKVKTSSGENAIYLMNKTNFKKLPKQTKEKIIKESNVLKEYYETKKIA